MGKQRKKDIKEVTSICSNCSKDVPENEVQQCDICGMDGLGNCCIGQLDHECIDDDNEE